MILLNSSLKYFSKHYIQSFLAILGIVLGVCMVVSIDLCIESSKKAFETSVTQSFGKATHYIYADENGFSEDLYTKLKLDYGLQYASPYIESNLKVRSSASEWRKLKLIGVDPFSYKDFAQSKEKIFSYDAENDFKEFLLCNDCGFVSKNTAESLALEEGDLLELQVETGFKQIKILRILDSKDFDNLLILDLSTAQGVLGFEGLISRIDLIERDSGELDAIKETLPKGLEIIPTLQSKKSTQKMLSSFNLNLYSLSFLSLIVAIFLIFNTISFSVTQRQTIFGLMATLGMKKRSIFGFVVIETIFIAIIASIIGLFTGIALSKFLMQFITQTINDLYFVLNVTDIYIAPMTLLKGFLAGMGAAIIGALIPAYSASKVQAVQITKRSTQETQARFLINRLPIGSLVALALAYLIISFSGDNIVLNFMGLGLIILAAAMLAPIVISWIIKAFNFCFAKSLNNINKIAINSIDKNLSRTSIAITALMIALSISLSLDITVGSFRETVKDWLESTLRADVYVSAPSLRANRTTGTLSADLIEKIKNHPVIEEESKAIITYRNNDASSSIGNIRIASIDLNQEVTESFNFKKLVPNWLDKFQNENSIIISEPLAYKNNLKEGSVISIKTNEGYKDFKVLGIFFDYGSDQGIAMIYKASYQKLWQDFGLSSIGIITNSPDRKEEQVDRIKSALAELNLEYNFNYRSNFEIKEESIKIFNRTFRITEALKIVTIFIAFISIISVLLSLNLERYKEFAILEAIGLNKKELAILTTVQSLAMGLIAALLSYPLGILEAYLLVHVINLRSFGWTLNFDLGSGVYLQILIMAILAPLLASLYPSYTHKRTALALRND